MLIETHRLRQNNRGLSPVSIIFQSLEMSALRGLEYCSESYRFGSEAIKQTEFRLGGIFTPVEDNPGQVLIFAEVQ